MFAPIINHHSKYKVNRKHRKKDLIIMFKMDDYRDAFSKLYLAVTYKVLNRYDNPNMTSLKIKWTNPRNSSLVKNKASSIKVGIKIVLM